MNITITVSEKTEQIIKEKAEENGKDVAEFVGEFVEENFAYEETNGNNRRVAPENKLERRFMRMKGMFSGGDGNSAERVKEIILAEIDSVEGLSKK